MSQLWEKYLWDGWMLYTYSDIGRKNEMKEIPNDMKNQK